MDKVSGLYLQTLEVAPNGANPSPELPDAKEGIIPLSVVYYDVGAFAVNVTVKCKLVGLAGKDATQWAWQLATFDKIYTAYKAWLTEYNQKVTEAKAQAASAISIEGRNPALNLETIKQELKKHCVTMLTGQHFGFGPMVVDREISDSTSDPKPKLPEIDIQETLGRRPIIQFFEQAFDWQQITYLFYPYFWAYKPGWISKANLSDPTLSLPNSFRRAPREWCLPLRHIMNMLSSIFSIIPILTGRRGFGSEASHPRWATRFMYQSPRS